MSLTASNPTAFPASPGKAESSAAPLFDQTRETLLRFAWRQWTQVGVAGDAAVSDSWLIDVEALLLFTFEIGRFDPRLFDEVLDWCVLNADVISVQRLKNLLRITRSWESDTERTVAAFGEIMAAQTNQSRFRALSSRVSLQDAKQAPFFSAWDGSALPVFGAADSHFSRFGWQRSPVVLRGLSVASSWETSAALLLRLRSLFGLSPRAETLAYLLTHTSGGIREIARAVNYSPTAILETLNAWSRGGFVVSFGRRGYMLSNDSAKNWSAFLGTHPPLWIDWGRVLPSLCMTLREFAVLRSSRSGYLTASRFLRLHAELQDVLFGTGLPNPFTGPIDLTNSETVFTERWQLFLDALTPASRESPADADCS
jgi:hypothetical protein